MRKTVPAVIQVLLAVILLDAALAILSPLIGLQLARRGVAPEVIGLISSAYYGGFLVGTLTCHKIIDRVGHIRAFGVFAVVAANSTLLHILFTDAYFWIGLRIVVGYGVAGLVVIVESWLNDKATTENRGRVFALYMAVTWAASGLGPLALNIDDPTGQILFVMITMLIAFSLVPMSLTKIRNPEISQRQHFGISRLYSISPTGTIVSFASGLVPTSIYALLPFYTEEKGYSTAQLSIVFSLAVIAGLVIQFPIGHLADRLGRRPLMLASALGAAVTSVALVFLGDRSFWWLLALYFLLEGLLAPLYALAVGQASDYVEKKDFVATSAGLLFAWGVGASLGPTVGGILIRPLGAEGLFMFTAASLLLIAIFVAYRMMRRQAKSVLEQSNYVAVPQTAATWGAPELDPRGEPESEERPKVPKTEDIA
ncbi:MAG: MFS transporter [Dongiaceae bacterium]